MTSVVTRPQSGYSRLPQDVQARLNTRLQTPAADPPAPVQPPVTGSPKERRSSSKAAIRFHQVNKSYKGGNQALRNVDFTINQGDFLFVTGPSGAGKSTLLKLLYGQERPSSGSVHVNGQELSKLRGNRLAMLRRQIGIVFQDYKLIPRRTVAENVSFVLWAQGHSRKEINRRLRPTLRMVGLQHKADSFPEQLSGGEQQRVSIARAVVSTPPLLLADEPTGNLDSDNSRQVIKILEKLHSIGITVIVTTHDEQLVRNSSHPVVQINDGRLTYVRR